MSLKLASSSIRKECEVTVFVNFEILLSFIGDKTTQESLILADDVLNKAKVLFGLTVKRRELLPSFLSHFRPKEGGRILQLRDLREEDDEQELGSAVVPLSDLANAVVDGISAIGLG